jgi:tetraacyldisaccharide 4'-kinase
LLSGSDFRALVSGQRRGLAATAARGLLATAEIPYALAMRWRNRRFDAGHDVHRVAVPVISVGNLTLGGTGKTPLVEWLARWYRARGVRVSLISRGYGAAPNAVNDEALELEQKLPDVPHLQNRDRVAAAAVAIEELDTQLILLDDGFQHRRLARDLDIVVLDASEPFGWEHVFPRGTLREPLTGLSRADLLVLSRADLVAPETRTAIRQRAMRYAPRAKWVEAVHAPKSLLSATGREEELSWLAGTRVAAFCGLGNPAGFRHTLARCNCKLVDFREFPDHHRYTRDDVNALIRWAESLDVDEVITTHKDLVKIGIDYLGQRPLWALVVGLQIQTGLDALEERLQQLMPRPEAADA